MQLISLFTLLPLLINAAPLISLPTTKPFGILSGNITIGGVGLVGLGGVAAVPGAASSLVAKVSAIPGVVTVVPAVLANAGAAVVPGIAGSLPTILKGDSNPNGRLAESGSPSLTPVIDKLSGYIANPSVPSVVTTIAQLNTIVGNLQQVVNGQVQALQGQVDLAKVVAYTVALIQNLSLYLDSLPSYILTDGSIIASAAAIDALVAGYILGLQVIGLSTAAFLQEVSKQGLTLSNLSPLLVKTAAIFPPA